MRKNILLFLKNEKGAALMTTLIALMVLSVLGTVFISSMTTEGIQSIQHDNKSRAYYLARSGSEAVYEVLVNEDEKGNLQAFVDQNPTIYGDLQASGLKIDTGNNNFEEESIVVNVNAVKKENGDIDVIEITSSGQQGGQKREVILKLFAPEFASSGLTISEGEVQFELDRFERSNDLGWSSGNAGRINSGLYDPVQESVRFEGPSGEDNSLRLNPNNEAFFTADEMYFGSRSTIMQNSTLHLTANKFLFDNTFDIYSGGRLCLYAPGLDDAIFRFRLDLRYDNNEILDDETYVIPADGKICFPLGDTSGPSLSEWPKKWE